MEHMQATSEEISVRNEGKKKKKSLGYRYVG